MQRDVYVYLGLAYHNKEFVYLSVGKIKFIIKLRQDVTVLRIIQELEQLVFLVILIVTMLIVNALTALLIHLQIMVNVSV
jgi:hypothetical protein